MCIDSHKHSDYGGKQRMFKKIRRVQSRKIEMRWIHDLAAVLLLIPAIGSAQSYVDASGTVNVLLIKDPYTDSRSGPEQLKGPDHLEASGIQDILEKAGFRIAKFEQVRMPAELEREYGEWNRASLTNRTLGRFIAAHDQNEYFIIGLLSGSKSLVGMLAGLQHQGPGRKPLVDSRGRDILGVPRLKENSPLKIGLLWMDAKAAFNTPDITVSGDMGGMNVAVAAGRCNTTLRLQAGLDPPLSTRCIVMAGVRDVSPYEQVHIDESFIEHISVEDIKTRAPNVKDQMDRLSALTDIIYVHIDMSVLDASEIPGHPHAAGDGPTSQELAACLALIFTYPKASATGIASMPENPAEITFTAANRLIQGIVTGIKSR